MGTIELFDGYFIEIDPMNYTLKQKYKGKSMNGEEREAFRIFGYYPNLKSALKRFSDLVRLDEIKHTTISLDDYVNAIENADKKLMAFLEKLEVRHADP